MIPLTDIFVDVVVLLLTPLADWLVILCGTIVFLAIVHSLVSIMQPIRR
jgi:hypothetical protein